MRRVTPTRAVLAALALAAALLCAYGVLASFEPGPRAIQFRVLYATVGAAALSAGAWLLFWKE